LTERGDDSGGLLRTELDKKRDWGPENSTIMLLRGKGVSIVQRGYKSRKFQPSVTPEKGAWMTGKWGVGGKGNNHPGI